MDVAPGTAWDQSAKDKRCKGSIRKGVIWLIRLELKHNEPIDKALRRFKKICNREGLTRDMRKQSNYEKPSEARKRKEREQERTRAKNLRQTDKRRDKARKARQKALKSARAQRNAAKTRSHDRDRDRD